MSVDRAETAWSRTERDACVLRSAAFPNSPEAVGFFVGVRA
ncbi:MAG: hypothetical protein N3F11_02850 [Casimicrobiaceae bacterium]|nr:hypothetical protein [Casimicrobiaceae bacterium]